MEALKSACAPSLQSPASIRIHTLCKVAVSNPTEVEAFEDALQSSKKVLGSRVWTISLFAIADVRTDGGQDKDTFKCEEEIQKLQIVVEMAVKLLDQKANLLFY
jgi:hypothetical protein